MSQDPSKLPVRERLALVAAPPSESLIDRALEQATKAMTAYQDVVSQLGEAILLKMQDQGIHEVTLESEITWYDSDSDTQRCISEVARLDGVLVVIDAASGHHIETVALPNASLQHRVLEAVSYRLREQLSVGEPDAAEFVDCEEESVDSPGRRI